MKTALTLALALAPAETVGFAPLTLTLKLWLAVSPFFLSVATIVIVAAMGFGGVQVKTPVVALMAAPAGAPLAKLYDRASPLMAGVPVTVNLSWVVATTVLAVMAGSVGLAGCHRHGEGPGGGKAVLLVGGHDANFAAKGSFRRRLCIAGIEPLTMPLLQPSSESP